MVTIVSLMPNGHNLSGHDAGYHQLIGRAAKTNGWNHKAALPIDSTVEPVPNGWSKVLYTVENTHLLKGLQKTKTKLLYIKNLYAYIKELLKSEGKFIFFMESFAKSNVIALWLAFKLLSKKDKERVSAWILYRFSPFDLGSSGKIYRWVGKRIKQMLKPGKFQILTDSSTLPAEYESFFGQPVHLFPTIGSEIPKTERFPKGENEIILWWPGKPKEAKGWSHIRRLASLSSSTAKNFRLIAANCANLEAPDTGVTLQPLKDILPRDDFEKWMNSCDIVLLPYNPGDYGNSTSGLFIESICAGKIPVVAEGTLMATELRKYQLDELILDWWSDDLYQLLVSINENKNIKIKLKTIAEEFRRFNSEESFAQIMKTIYGS